MVDRRERLGAPFPFAQELKAKPRELEEINASLAANNNGEEQGAA